MSNTYDSKKLLSNLNVTNWDHHICELLSAFPIMGRAIRTGVPFIPRPPTFNDLFADGVTRKYHFRTDGITLDGESRKDFTNACSTFEKSEVRREEEQAKICGLLISSFSEEAKMLLRSNRAYISAANTNDSYEIYKTAKAAHTRVTSFAVAQNRSSSRSPRPAPTPPTRMLSSTVVVPSTRSLIQPPQALCLSTTSSPWSLSMDFPKISDT